MSRDECQACIHCFKHRTTDRRLSTAVALSPSYPSSSTLIESATMPQSGRWTFFGMRHWPAPICMPCSAASSKPLFSQLIPVLGKPLSPFFFAGMFVGPLQNPDRHCPSILPSSGGPAIAISLIQRRKPKRTTI